jgi:hypothetical protein
MPANVGMRSNPGIQDPTTAAGVQPAVLTQFSDPSNQPRPDSQLGAINASRPLNEFPGVTKPGSGKSAKLQIQPAQGNASGALPSVTLAAHAANVTASVQGADGFGLARDASSMQAANGAATGTGGSPTSAQGVLTAHQTFATLDNIDDRAALNWVQAGSRHAEAGFEDPALGWIGVRADQSGGAVHATLVPTTADAAQALGSQMAGLNAHLAQSQTPVASLSLGSTESWAGGATSDQNLNQGAGQNQAQSNPQDARVNSTESIRSSPSIASVAVSAPAASPGLLDHEAKLISVMA